MALDRVLHEGKPCRTLAAVLAARAETERLRLRVLAEHARMSDRSVALDGYAELIERRLAEDKAP